MGPGSETGPVRGMRELACQAEPGLFFPTVGESWTERKTRKEKAKGLCRAGCPVLLRCRQLGVEAERATLEEGDPDRYSSHGVWGGLERKELLKLPVE
jgi:hypothetical protein